MFTSGGAAVAVGDFDNDGFDDLFVTDSAEGTTSKLYRNNGNMTFTDVTAKAGVGGGNDPLSIVADALWFDYDNDGWRDLLVARFGTPLVYHNEKNGVFKDVSAQTGLNKFGNTIAVMAFDYDNDGKLDLLFGNYFKPQNLLEPAGIQKDPHVLPNDLDNAVNGGGVTLWHAVAAGRWEEVTEKAGFAKHTGWTLDLGHGDFNNDGLQDVYLACDYGTDRIFFNNGDGTFRDTTEKSLGFDTRKGMNAEVGDYDNDGWLDIYVTNITDEYMKECNMLWHNNHDGTFTDVSKETGTCETLWGWAAKFGDFDNDGLLDLFVVNGLRSAGQRELHPDPRGPHHAARRGLHRRARLAQHRRDDVERVPEEEVLPESRRQQLQGNVGRRRRGQRQGRPRHRRGRLRQRRAPGLLPGQCRPAVTVLSQHDHRGRTLAVAQARRIGLEPRRDRRARDDQGRRQVDDARGRRRQRLRRREHAARALRPGRGHDADLGADSLAERDRADGHAADRQGHDDPGTTHVPIALTRQARQER